MNVITDLRGGGGGKTLVLALLVLAALLGALLLSLKSAEAQTTPGPAASIEIGEPLGSLAEGSYIQLTATVTDADGNAVADGTTVTWEVLTPAGEVPVFLHAVGNSTTATSAGDTRALFLALGTGTGTITATSGAASGETDLIVSAITDEPPAPARIFVTAPEELRRTATRFTVRATVTDTNGAPVPDGTPISWEMAGALAQNLSFTALSQDRVTTNGQASATYQVAIPMGDTTAAVLATASAGNASGTQYLETARTLPVPPNPATATLTSDKPSWMLLEIGDTVTVTATVTDADGAAVSDGTTVTWLIITGGFTTVSTETVTTAGSATATLQAAEMGKGIGTATVRIGDVLGTVGLPWIGSYPDPPADLALSLRLPDDSDGIVPTDSTLQVGAALTSTGQGQTVYLSEGALRIAGNQDWESSGRSSLTIDGQIVTTFPQASWTLGDLNTCKGVSVDGQTDWTCAIELDNATIYIPAGTPNGTFTISGTITVNGRKYTDTIEVTVVEPGSIDEVAEVQFDFAERERGANRGEPYPANIPVGGDTKFRLKVLNEHGKASATGSIASILLTTTIGSLSADLGTDCTGGATCQIPVSAITAANADKIDVTLTYTADSKAGRGEVRATVIAGDGETFSRGPISVTLVGAAASLAISEPATGLLSAATTTANDNRDVLKLTVTAADAEGNSVDVPYRTPRATITGPNGNLVSSGIGVVWTEDGDDPDEAHDQFTLNAAKAVEATISVTAEAASPLEVGEYILELRTAGKTATRTFTVGGEAASVALGEPQGSLELDGTVSFTATVRDAAGALVSDGTPVVWSALSTSESPVLVQISADTSTRDGAATATYLSVNAGTAIVAAESGDGREVRVMTIAAAPAAVGAAATADLSESLSNRGRLGFAVWLGERATSASALLDSLSEVNSILLWQDGRWQRYGRHEGRIIPGSFDFQIPRGAIIWLDR